MRTMGALRAFPALVLALSINAVLGPGIGNVMVAIGVVSTPTFARLTHAQTLSAREREYAQAARVTGIGAWRMMLRHILPNIAAPLIVQASLGVAFAILAEAGLSFLGLGARPPAQRAAVPERRAVVGHVSRPGHFPGRAGVQPARRRLA